MWIWRRVISGETRSISKELIDSSTNQIKSILNLKNSDVIYTSGSSEANNLAIKAPIPNMLALKNNFLLPKFNSNT